MEQPSLLIEQTGNIGTLILNRPEKKNSLSPELVEKLLAVLKQLSADEAIRTLVIRGSGDHAFCAGYDIGALSAKTDEDTDAHIQRLGRVELLFQAIVQFPWPVIVMLNGAAFGAGLELAICGDLRIGAEDIRMGMPPAKLGIVYPWNGLKRFVQVIGLQATKEMFFTGRVYAQDSKLKEMGLVDHFTSRPDLETKTYQMAEMIAGNAPLALKGTKKVINLISDTLKLHGDNRILAESLTQRAFVSDDAKEGRRAFFEKRAPRFKGR